LSGENNEINKRNSDIPDAEMLKNIDEVRKSFLKKRNLLNTMYHQFESKARNAPNDFEREIYDAISKQALVTRSLTVWMESMVIGNLGMKMQHDTLKDIVIQLREVKGNPQMMEDIAAAFRDYDRTNI
jgi:hypothetical protein